MFSILIKNYCIVSGSDKSGAVVFQGLPLNFKVAEMVGWGNDTCS